MSSVTIFFGERVLVSYDGEPPQIGEVVWWTDMVPVTRSETTRWRVVSRELSLRRFTQLGEISPRWEVQVEPAPTAGMLKHPPPLYRADDESEAEQRRSEDEG